MCDDVLRVVDSSMSAEAGFRRFQGEVAEARGGRGQHDEGGVHEDEAGIGSVSGTCVQLGSSIPMDMVFFYSWVFLNVPGNIWPRLRRQWRCTKCF